MRWVEGDRGPRGEKQSRRAGSTQHIVTGAQETSVELGRDETGHLDVGSNMCASSGSFCPGEGLLPQDGPSSASLKPWVPWKV